MSNIRSLYTALAALDITFTTEAGGNSTPTGYDLDSLLQSVDTAQLPCRLLLPTEEYGSDGQGMELLAAGNGGSAEVMWNITDLMLWEPVGQTRGFLDVLPDLVRYCGQYASVLLDNRTPATNIQFMTVSFRPGVFTYPLGGNRSYFGVEVLSTWRELINP